MAASGTSDQKAGKQLVARSSFPKKAPVLQNGRIRKMKKIIIISNLCAQTRGFKIQTIRRTKTKTLITQDLAMGFSRELHQTLSGRILHNFDSTQNEFEDFFETRVSGLVSLPHQPTEVNTLKLGLSQ